MIILDNTLKGIQAVYDSITDSFFVHQVLGPNIFSSFLSFDKQQKYKLIFTV